MALKSREDCLDYAEAHGIPVAASRKRSTRATATCGTLSHEAASWRTRQRAVDHNLDMTRSRRKRPTAKEVWRLATSKAGPSLSTA